MENKSYALWAGLFTIVMLCTTILAGIWLNSDKTERVDYHIVTSKPIVGLNPQAAVRYKGLTVGRVNQIKFDPQVAGQINITIGINSETPITQSTFATLGYQGVTGIAFVQLDDDGSKPAKIASDQHGELRIPLRPGLLDKLEKSGARILTNAEIVSDRLVQLFTSENQKVMLDAFAGMTQAANDWALVAKELKPTIEGMPTTMQQANQTLQSVQTLSQEATLLSQQLTGLVKQLQDPNGSLNQTLGALNNLSERAQLDTLPKITQLTNEATDSMRTLNKTLQDLNDRPQNLLFGKPAAAPGPGEAGFVEPQK